MYTIFSTVTVPYSYSQVDESVINRRDSVICVTKYVSILNVPDIYSVFGG